MPSLFIRYLKKKLLRPLCGYHFKGQLVKEGEMTSFEFNEAVLRKLQQQVVEQYVSTHRNECAYCHKPLTPPPDLKPNQLPVCAECAKKLRS